MDRVWMLQKRRELPRPGPDVSANARANARALSWTNAIAYSSAIGHADAKPDAAAYHEKRDDRP